MQWWAGFGARCVTVYRVGQGGHLESLSRCYVLVRVLFCDYVGLKFYALQFFFMIK